MQSWRLTLAIALLVAITVLVGPYAALAQGESPAEESALSPFWDPAVSRWESIILREAHNRSLDPDLIAAVIRKESSGRPTASGPAGAVGLMMVMPFPWRTSAEELRNPWINLFYGARTLSIVIRDGDGDLYYALAAYNGSWAKVHRNSTRRYAASVLDHYTRAVAMRYGLPADGEWIAIFAVEGTTGPNTITVIGPQRPLTRYTERPWVQADIPTAPTSVPPHATVATFVDERGMECRVNMWLVEEDGSPPMLPAEQAMPSPSPAGYGRTETETPAPTITATAVSIPGPIPTPMPTTTPGATPTRPPVPADTPIQPPAPTSAPAPASTVTAVVLAGGANLYSFPDAWWQPFQTLPAWTDLEPIGYDPSFSKWAYVRTADGASTGWVQVADLAVSYEELIGLPRLTPVPTLTTLPAECESGPLRLEAWDLDRVRTEDGWTATVYVQGHGGNCLYTYGWEGEVKGGPTTGPMLFEVSSTTPKAAILGTVAVASGNETVKAGLHIKP